MRKKRTTNKRPKRKIHRRVHAPPSALNRSSLLTQLMIGLTAVCVFAVLGIMDSGRFALLTGRAQISAPPPAVTVGIEQVSAPKISILLARKGGEGYVKLWNDADDPVRISLPVEWQRLEVHDTTLAAVTAGKIEFGFVPWTLPAHAGMTMLLGPAPDAIEFVSISPAPAAVSVKTVDLLTQTKDRHVVLVKDKTIVKLWQSE